MALQALGRVEQARAALTRALSLAEPEGYVRTFIDEGAPMGELLATVLAAQRTRRDESSQRMAGYVAGCCRPWPGKRPGEGRPLPLRPRWSSR